MARPSSSAMRSIKRWLHLIAERQRRRVLLPDKRGGLKSEKLRFAWIHSSDHRPTISKSGKPGSMIPLSFPDPQSKLKDASRHAPELYREVLSMPTAKEFTLTMDDRPG